MATFGKTDAGATTGSSSADKMAASRAIPATSGTLLWGHARVWLDTAGQSTPMKMMIYTDNGGAPDALLSTSDTVTVSGTAAQIVDFEFTGTDDQIPVVAGTPYWIALFWKKPSTGAVVYGRDNTAGARRERSGLAFPAEPDNFTPDATTFAGPIAVWGETTGGGGGGPTGVPGAVFDLGRWHLTLPTDGGDSGSEADQINQPALDSFTDANFLLDANNRMVMVAPVEGATTSAASGATRCELREREPNYSEAAWSMATTGRRQLTVTTRVDASTVGGTGRKEEIISQIHGATGTPPVYVAAEYHVTPARVRVYKNGPGLANPVTNLTPDMAITMRYLIEDGRVKLWVIAGEVAALPSTPTYDWPATDFTDATGCYFKVGAYNKTDIGSGGTGQVSAKISYLELIQPGGTPPPPDGCVDEGGGGGTPLPANPGEALWIGSTAGKNHFNVGIGGPGGATDHTDYDQTAIAGGFSQDPKFKLTDDRGAVQFRINVGDGRTSSGTSYPRSELRELNADGTRAAWSGSSGTHYMKGKSRVTHTAVTKPWVCIFQIHDASSDLVRIQTESGGSGPTGLRVRSRHTPPGGSEVTTTLLNSYTVGDWLDWDIRIVSGTLTVTINGTQVLNVSGMGTTGCYFKTGCYAQSNTSTEGGDASQYFSTEMEAGSLEVWHTSTPTPTTPVYTGPEGGSGGGGGGGGEQQTDPPGVLFNLDNWRLTLPTDGPDTDTDADVIAQTVLETFKDINFYLDCQDRMVLVAPVQGAVAPTGGGGGGSGLAAPANPDGSVSAAREFTFTWDAVAGATEYEVHEMLTDPANTLKAVVTGTSRVSNPLTVGGHYEYRVKARNTSSTSPFSDSVIVDITANGGTVTTGGGGTPPAGAVPWTRTHPDGTAYATPAGGSGTETTTSSVSGLTGIANGTVVRYTGATLTTDFTISGKSNITIRGVVMSGGTMTLTNCQNVIIEGCDFPYELQSGGDANLYLRGTTDQVTVRDCMFGPATANGSPGVFKSRFIKYGDSASAGHGRVTVSRCTFRNKNNPGNPIHTAGDTAAAGGDGGVHHVLVTQCLFKSVKPFDENDHESALMGLSNMQLTNGQVVIEFSRFFDCASEPEVVSMKMNNSRVRGCTFVDHVGSVSLRHGDDGAIHDCWMVSDQVAGTNRQAAGTRMYGANHHIHHNTIRVKGGANFERPILLDTGDVAPGSTSNGHANVVNALVEDNLLVSCEAPIVVGDNYTTAPTGTIRNNKVVACTGAGTTGIQIVGGTSMAGITTAGNLVYATTGAAGLTQGANSEWKDPTGDTGARTPFVTESMVGKNSTWDPWV